MVSRHWVEPGRLCLLKEQRVVIVDILDARMVLVVGEQVQRQLISIGQLKVTKHKIDIMRGAKNKTVFKKLNELGLMENSKT